MLFINGSESAIDLGIILSEPVQSLDNKKVIKTLSLR